MSDAKIPKCSHCNKPATCFGHYENQDGYGCDECCGHGCEDGYCEGLDEEMSSFWLPRRELFDARQQLVAVAKAAKDCLENAKLMGITHSGLDAALSALDPDVLEEDEAK